MRRLLTLGVILFSSFSIGSKEECCKQMTVGDQLYHYVGWDDTSQSQHNCDSNCLYSTDCDPGKRVCFKKEFVTGEKSQEKSVCHNMEGPKTVPGEQCDRPCFSFFPSLTCVFTFTLEMWKSDVDGRRADGRVRSVLTYNKQIPGPPIVICEGDELVVKFLNNINGNMSNMDGSSNVSTLHFHGIREKTRPWSDGVPFVSQCPITPEGPFFPVLNQNPSPFPYGFNTNVDGAPAGTYWYHSHVGAQRTNGAYGALIIKETLLYGTCDKEKIIDDAKNTLVLQEWYESSTNQVPVSILINGKGRIGPKKYTGGDKEISNHLQGKGASFTLADNTDFDKDNFKTNYAEFDVKPGKSYRFRVIGAISQNFPLRLSIDDHKFTAIAMDSLNIEPVPDLNALWLAAGERYDIVVKTKKFYNINGQIFKIRVLGFTDQSDQSGPLCTIAWLKYPKQNIDPTYVTHSACNGFYPFSSQLRTLNPVPNKYTAWENRMKYPAWKHPGIGDIFIADLRAKKPEPTINILGLPLNTHYIEFAGNITFNNLRMTYPRVLFLLQDPPDETERCGSVCTSTKCTTKTPANCTAGQYCKCQNILQEPWAKDHWTEIVLVNNHDWAAAHPIHQHGGWYWVVGEGQYNNSFTVNRQFIMQQDTGKKTLPRNFKNPPAKDTIQVPPRGYVIIRTKLDNAGTWIFHCHINYHVTIGMAMVLQIGEPGDWSTKPLEQKIECETPPPPPGGGPTTINWYLHMENAERCVAPGTTVTFTWEDGHNVNMLSKTHYDNCNVHNTTAFSGDQLWTAPMLDGKVSETYYFACGMGGGWHCNHGMKAKIYVRNSCTH